MKKLLAALAALVLLTCTPIAVPAQDVPKVGDPMPDMISYADEYHMNFVERPYPGYILRMYLYHGQPKIYMAFAVCNGMKAEKPFGVCVFGQSMDEALLFIDNAPTDGILDEVTRNPVDRMISSDLPECL